MTQRTARSDGRGRAGWRVRAVLHVVHELRDALLEHRMLILAGAGRRSSRTRT